MCMTKAERSRGHAVRCDECMSRNRQLIIWRLDHLRKLSYLGINVIGTVLSTLFRNFYQEFLHNTTTTSTQLLLCYPSVPTTEEVGLMNPDLEYPVYQ